MSYNGAVSRLPQAAASRQQQDPALPGGLLPPAASPRSALGSSPGRLSAEPGRRQRPCPGTQPLGHSRDPALHHSPGHPCLHARLLLPPGAAAALPSSQRLTGVRAGKCSPPASSVHPATSACLYPLCLCRQCPQPCCAGQRSCSWAELALCSAARLPGAPLGPRSPAQLSSTGPAQGLPCSAPHQAPCPWPWGCRGTCWETA